MGYIQFNRHMRDKRSKSRWRCPICSSLVKPGSLTVDMFFVNILDGLPKVPEIRDAVDNVQVEPNGEWTIPVRVKREKTRKRHGPLSSSCGNDDKKKKKKKTDEN